VPLLDDVVYAQPGQTITGVADGQTVVLPQADDGAAVTVVVDAVKNPITIVGPDGTTQVVGTPGVVTWVASGTGWETEPGNLLASNVPTDRLLGRDTPGDGALELIAVAGGLEFSGSQSIQIASNGVTNPLLADMASPRLKGRTTSGLGDPEDLTLTSSTSISWNTASGGAISLERAALTGEVTATANANATTVVRSTDFQASPWTGDHQFSGELRLGTLHTESAVSGALNVTLTAGATRLLITSTADLTLGTISGCAEGRVLYVEHARSSGTGHLSVTHGTGTNAVSCPGDHDFPVRGRGGFILVGRGTNWKLINRDAGAAAVQTDGGGGGNNFALNRATNILLVTADANYTGFVRTGGNDDGDRFYLQADAGVTITLPFNSGSSSTGNRVSGVNAITHTIRSRGLVELLYRDQLWRIINFADVFAGTANTFTAANTFQGLVALAAQVAFSTTISPSAISSNQNNYSPTGWSTANVIRLSTDGSTRDLTGAAAGSSGELKWLINLGPQTIRLQSEDTNSTAANRFLFASGTTFGILSNGVVGILYDGTSSRWRPIVHTAFT
jgi:hypothetical protein